MNISCCFWRRLWKDHAGFGIGRAWFILTGCTPVCIDVNGLYSIINTFKLGEFVCCMQSWSRISPAFTCSRISPAFTCYLGSRQWISTGDLSTAFCSSPISQTYTSISVIFILNFPPPCSLHQKEVAVTQNLNLLHLLNIIMLSFAFSIVKTFKIWLQI